MTLALSNRTFAEGALSGNSFSFQLVRAAGESLLVWVVSKKNIGTADNISSVVWDPTGDNQVMSVIGVDTATYQGYRYGLYKLELPTSAKTGNVVVNFAGASNNIAQVEVEHWTGVDTAGMTGPLIKSMNQVFTSSTQLSQTVPSAVGEFVTGFMSVNDVPGGIAAAAGQTNVVVRGAAAPCIGSSIKAGAANVTMGWTTTAQTTYENAWFLITIKPAAAPAATVPGAPTIGAATVTGATSVSVAGTAPVSDGGAAIDLYRATSTPGGITATSATLPVPVPGLTTGTAYTFRLEAHNTVGWSSQSAASNSATPVAGNVAPAFGGTYPNVSGNIGTALSAPVASTYFTDSETLTYSASPAGTAWPAGVTCNAATGQPVGTPTGSAATTTGCKIRASDGSLTTDSNAFNFVIAAATTVGTITSTPLVNRTVNPATGAVTSYALFANLTGLIGWVTTLLGVPVGPVKTGLSTDASGVMTVSDAAYVPGTSYIQFYRNPATGMFGWQYRTAA